MAGRRDDSERRTSAVRVGRIHRRGPWARFATEDLRNSGESLVALALLAASSVVAGLALGSATGRLEDLPGLLLMAPAAIALRGNIFGAMGSRLGTSIHSGTFRWSFRPTGVVGANVAAALVLTVVTSVALAVLGKATAVAFGIADSLALVDFLLISFVGGLLASAVVLFMALMLAAGSVRFGWDPDNVTAPLVTAAGDAATLPALILASLLVGNTAVGWSVAGVAIVGAALGLLVIVRRAWLPLGSAREIIVESLPVLLIAIVMDLIAGVAVERQLDRLVSAPSLLVLFPGFLAMAGALGAVLSSRLSSKLHLGVVEAAVWPGRGARRDIMSILLLAAPVFGFGAVVAALVARAASVGGPGLGGLLAVSLLGGGLALLLVVTVAYYATMAAVRFGVDPDTYGIPLVTAAVDLLGALVYLAIIDLVGVA